VVGNPQIEGKSEIEIRQTLGEPKGKKIVVERIYTDKNPQEAMGGGSKGGRDATNAPPRRPRRDAINRDAAVIERDAGLGRDAARHVATKTVGSTLIGDRRGWQGMRDAEGSAGRKAQCGENRRVWWGTMGGGIFAKTAKTPPLQSALAGGALGSK